MRTRSLAFGLLLGALAFAAVAPAAAAPPSLAAELFAGIDSEVDVSGNSCAPGATWTFRAVGRAAGPYHGRFAESGTITLGRMTLPPVFFEVASISASFSVWPDTKTSIAFGHMTATTIPGSLSVYCDLDPFDFTFDGTLLYSAMAYGLAGACTERGTAQLSLNRRSYLTPTAFFSQRFGFRPVGSCAT